MSDNQDLKSKILLMRQKNFGEIIDEFLTFIKDKTLIIHNAEFDLAHLNNELKIQGKEILKNKIVDTLVLARNKFPGSSISLDALCRRYRIDNSKRAQHTALIDCDLLAKVYINLLDQKEPKLNFSEIDGNFVNPKISKIDFCKNIIKASTEELKEHQKFLKKSLPPVYYFEQLDHSILPTLKLI